MVPSRRGAVWLVVALAVVGHARARELLQGGGGGGGGPQRILNNVRERARYCFHALREPLSRLRPARRTQPPPPNNAYIFDLTTPALSWAIQAGGARTSRRCCRTYAARERPRATPPAPPRCTHSRSPVHVRQSARLGTGAHARRVLTFRPFRRLVELSAGPPAPLVSPLVTHGERLAGSACGVARLRAPRQRLSCRLSHESIGRARPRAGLLDDTTVNSGAAIDKYSNIIFTGQFASPGLTFGPLATPTGAWRGASPPRVAAARALCRSDRTRWQLIRRRVR